ncbi:MAG: GTP-binding protein [Colwellia sp.]|nr:GTP-binding protein [Colwellia sp.]
MFTLITAKISAIPTSLITGFLGVGKTTAILQLLANKPKNENWAVLVNEFGEVGIDSALLAGNSNEKGVFIREVPGGCMCCASGVPMQVALNQLIAKSKPDRLIIEPTGLGHPKEVVEVLTSGKYQEIISLQSIFCLVDARNLSDKRYTEHPSFVQQLKVADIILAAKADKYSAQDEENLSAFIAKNDLSEKTLHLIQHGNVDPSWLTQEQNTAIAAKPMIGIAVPFSQKNSHDIQPSFQNALSYQNELKLNQALQTRLAQDGFIELNNQGEGYFSKGWIFSGKYMFDYQQLMALITSLNVTRVKGVVRTNKGNYSFNKAGSDFSCNKVTHSKDSRIELIDFNESILNKVTSEQLLMLKKNAI